MNSSPHKLNRSKLTIRQNDIVQYKKDKYIILELIDFKEVIAIDIKTNRSKRLQIKDLEIVEENLVDENKLHINRDVLDISDEEYSTIEHKYNLILPLLEKKLTREEIEEYSQSTNTHYTTLYRWLRNYKNSGNLMGLLDKKVGRPVGRKMLDPYTERIILNTIEDHYLTKQKPSVQKIIDLVFIQCKKANIEPPGKNTIRNRISELSEYKVLRRQGNKGIARTKYEPAPGSFQSEYPLQIIQIDHTPVDVIIVDDKNRLPIGRPWITLAVDIYSRMITGYYLSLDAPSSTSVAMCITNSIMPKDTTLLTNGIDDDWSVWGFPDIIHADNGADFRADALKKACLVNNIDIHFRPIQKTNYGGHIERLIGTIMREVHSIPGTTFSNIKQRQTYDSDGNACMTLKELEKWILTFITKIYHKRIHNTLKTSPYKKWEEGIFGTHLTQGIGYPPRPVDQHTLLLDFLPYVTRTIQKNGVNIDGINYYDHILRSKIHAVDSKTKAKKTFIFKRDPRDISKIWFYDEITHEYYQIPSSEQSLKNVSLWELNASKELLKEKGIKAVNIHQILEAKDELYSQIEEAVKKTKKARRDQQKIKNNKEIIKDIDKSFSKQDNEPINVNNDIWDDDIPDFD